MPERGALPWALPTCLTSPLAWITCPSAPEKPQERTRVGCGEAIVGCETLIIYASGAVKKQ